MALDPSRIAAGIISGIGVVSAGVIFVRQNIVNGLTTAASIWVTAAIGMARQHPVGRSRLSAIRLCWLDGLDREIAPVGGLLTAGLFPAGAAGS